MAVQRRQLISTGTMGRLLSINNYFYRRGGAETVFFAHNDVFARAGWSVAPFAMKHPKNEASDYDSFFVDEIEYGHDYSALARLQQAGKVIYSFEARQKLAALIDRFKPDVAHAHNIYHHLSPAILGVLASRNLPTILTLHDLKIGCPAYKMLSNGAVCEACRTGNIANVVLKKCIKASAAASSLVFLETLTHRLLGSYRNHVDRFVAPSRFYIDKLVDWGWPREKFVYIPNFVDCSQIRQNGPPGDYFLYFGRLGPEKGIATLIRAACSARVLLWIVGTGPEEPALRALAESLGANVTFTGYRSGASLAAAIEGSRAVVVPSEWYENAPLSVLEAYAHGRPVIGAAIGGIPELVQPGVTGAVFPAHGVEELAATLSQFSLMSTPAINDMGQRARAWVEAEFSPAHYLERMTALYASLSRGVHVAANAPDPLSARGAHSATAAMPESGGMPP